VKYEVKILKGEINSRPSIWDGKENDRKKKFKNFEI
jgi:hypothetical protein